MRCSGLLLALPFLLIVAGCSSEPTFDERYEAARGDMDSTAARIDAELDRRRKAAEQTGTGRQTPVTGKQDGALPRGTE